MTKIKKLQPTLLCLSILIINSTASSIIGLDETVRSNDEMWLGRSKYSTDDNRWRMLFISRSVKQPSAISSTIHSFKANTIDKRSSLSGDGLAVKQIDPRVREALNQLLTKLNNDRQKAIQASLDSDNSASSSTSRSVQSFYPKCDHNEEESKKNDENKLMSKDTKFMPLFYDLQQSSVMKSGNVVVKSNLRVHLKRLSNEDACECLADNEDDEDNQLRVSIYEILSRVTFLPFKEVAKKRPIETIKLNRCCDGQTITFDVKNVVQNWKRYPDSNNGFLLEITDNLGNKLNVDDYIQNMNCSDSSPPIPYLKLTHPDLPSKLIKQIDVFYPVLDVAFNRHDINLFNRIHSKQQLDDDQSDKDANV